MFAEGPAVGTIVGKNRAAKKRVMHILYDVDGTQTSISEDCASMQDIIAHDGNIHYDARFNTYVHNVNKKK